MHSMTGYGSSQSKNRHFETEVHVKSVNGRFLEIRFHLPKEYAPYENEFRKLFSGWKRGTVDVYVHRRVTPEARLQSISIHERNAKLWAQELKRLNKVLGLNTEVTLRDVLQMPMVMEHPDRGSLFSGEIKVVLKVLHSAIRKCQEFRQREGAVLKKEVLSLLRELEQKVNGMESWREQALKNSHQRLKSKLAALEAEQIDASRLALEAALLIDKMDVHEEVVRLKEHIQSCRALVQDGAAQGKKLDFYGQELLREVNTIGSKSQLATMTEAVVSAKAIIERFREQVQNIE